MNIFRLSTIAVAVTTIIGCGGGDDSSPSPAAKKPAAAVYHAEVTDEPLQNALVWLDTNNNYQLDKSEPSAYTNAEGKVSLDVSNVKQQPEGYSLIALAKENHTINKVTGTKVSKSYVMVAPVGIKKISPVTHLLHSTQQSTKVVLERAVAKTAELIEGVSEQQLREYLTNKDDNDLKDLSLSLMNVMPDGKTPLTQQLIVESHPKLKSAVVVFNKENQAATNPTPSPVVVKTEDSVSASTGSNVTSSTSTSQSESSQPNNNSGSSTSNEVEPFGSGNGDLSNVGGLSVENENQDNPQSGSNNNNGSDTNAGQSGDSQSGTDGSSNKELDNDLPPSEGETGAVQQTSQLSKLDTDINAVVDGMTKQISIAAKIETETQSKTVIGSAQDYLSSLTEGGYWQDLDYSQQSSAIEHLKRLEVIAVAYKSVDGQTLNIDAVDNAITYWINQNIALTGWWEEFGEFHSLAKTALLLGIDISTELKNKVAALIPMDMSTEKSGLNGTDPALANLYYGLLKSDENTIRNSIQEISTIIEKLTVQGEQPDWSVLLTTQLDSGKTGEDLFYELLNLVHSVNIGLKASTSELAFSHASTEVLASILLDGIRWMESLANSDTKTTDNNDENYQAALKTIVALVPTRQAEINKPLSGFKQFGYTASTMTLTDTFMFEIQMDTTSSESTNSDYVSFWSGLGGTSLSQSVEPYQNLTNVLGWSTIPGVTIPQYSTNPIYDAVTIPFSNFVGGATNGEVGVTTMAINMSEVRPSGSNVPPVKDGWVVSSTDRYYVNAKKSWFSFGSQIAVLGAGINSNHSVPINTIVAREVFSEDQYQTSFGSFTPEKGKVINYEEADWLHHKNVGYVFHDNLQPNGSILSYQADWPSESGQTTNTVKDIFTFWIPHGVGPTDSKYAYIMLPSTTVEETKSYNQNQSLEILANTTQVQAVKDNRRNITSAVFFQPGAFDTTESLKVEVDRPCVVILDLSGEQKKLTLSTPGLANQTVNVQVNGATPIAVITPAQAGNSITVNL